MDPHALAGRWTLARRVVDRRTSTYGTVTGQLEVTAESAGLRWHESGVFTWEGHRHPVTRTNLIQPVEGQWWVLFQDGRPFHPWRPGSWVTHPCAADLYDGIVVIDRDGDRMRTLWDVHGPTKQQRLITRLRRS